MMIEVDPAAIDGIVRAWIKDTLETIEINSTFYKPHPEDAKEYRKDIKALKRILDYVGID